MKLRNHELTSNIEIKSLETLRSEGWKFDPVIRSKGNGQFAIASLPSGQIISLPCSKESKPGETISGVRFIEETDGITAIGCRNIGANLT